MTTILVPRLPEIELINILSCIAQWLEDSKTDKIDTDSSTPKIIAVWYPEPAKSILHLDVNPGEYHVQSKVLENYRMEGNKEKVRSIWAKGYVPVEIIRCIGCCFMGIDKKNVKALNVRGAELKLFEF